jgi:hypothetical protein
MMEKKVFFLDALVSVHVFSCRIFELFVIIGSYTFCCRNVETRIYFFFLCEWPFLYKNKVQSWKVLFKLILELSIS